MFKINQENKYLVAVSGGPDSMFLLDNLLKQGLTNLVVCHVNYNFRIDSYYDQQVVEQFCLTNNLLLEIKTISPKTYSDLRENFESWARSQRYDFFVEIGHKYQIKNVLIAHNKNDVIETYLIQKARKSLVSFYGIKQITFYKDISVIRPMLKITKQEILTYLSTHQIGYALDSTNDNLKYLRNKIRSQLDLNQLDTYLDEIKLANIEVTKKNNEALFYANNNLTEKQLLITNQLIQRSISQIQVIIYEYLKLIGEHEILNNRNHKTLIEIANRIKKSKKPFWTISLNEKVIIKDFDYLYILNKEELIPKTLIVNCQQDLDQIEVFVNWLDLFKAIKKDGMNFPYVISTNFNDYKSITTYRNKKTNRALIDLKIPYKSRFFKAVAYNEIDFKILNRIN